MILRLKRAPAIYLVGFMGSGKTTVGRLLAQRLGWRFVDLDDDIEAAEGAAIRTIFEERGEAEFRRAEARAIAARVDEARRGHPMVIALGGGAFAEPENAKLVKEHGIAIWLDCPFSRVRQRVVDDGVRPLARDPERFRELFEKRQAAYAQADYRVPISSDDPEEALRSILELPGFSELA